MSDQILNSGYYHGMPGRLRVRVANLKNRAKTAKSLEVLLMSEAGVKHVRANPITGNVLVVFDERITYHCAILESLAELGHAPLISENNDCMADVDAMCDFGLKIGKHIAKTALKRALVGSPAMILLDLL